MLVEIAIGRLDNCPGTMCSCQFIFSDDVGDQQMRLVKFAVDMTRMSGAQNLESVALLCEEGGPTFMIL